MSWMMNAESADDMDPAVKERYTGIPYRHRKRKKKGKEYKEYLVLGVLVFFVALACGQTTLFASKAQQIGSESGFYDFQPGFFQVLSASIPIYEEAGEEDTVLGHIYRGQKAYVQATNGCWGKISLGGTSGWIDMSFCSNKVDSTVETDQAVENLTAELETQAWDGSSTDAPQIVTDTETGENGNSVLILGITSCSLIFALFNLILIIIVIYGLYKEKKNLRRFDAGLKNLQDQLGENNVIIHQLQVTESQKKTQQLLEELKSQYTEIVKMRATAEQKGVISRTFAKKTGSIIEKLNICMCEMPFSEENNNLRIRKAIEDLRQLSTIDNLKSAEESLYEVIKELKRNI